MIGVDWLLQWHNYAILHELGAMFLWSDALPGANHAKCLERAVYACLSRFHTRHIGLVGDFCSIVFVQKILVAAFQV